MRFSVVAGDLVQTCLFTWIETGRIESQADFCLNSGSIYNSTFLQNCLNICTDGASNPGKRKGKSDSCAIATGFKSDNFQNVKITAVQ